MRQLLFICLLAIGIQSAEFPEIGTVTSTNAVGWDSAGGNVTGYNIYLSLTNQATFTKQATVSTNRWNGDSTKTLSGWRVMYVTSVFGTDESDPSEKVLVQFRAGVPLPPTNIAIYSLIQAAATNVLPVVVTNVPPTIPPP